MNRLLACAAACLLLLLAPLSACAENLTQRDWLINLVNGLGWSFGLPDTPSDWDYLTIVGGVRYLHLEAEDHIRREDQVSAKKHLVFGDFSGEAWVSGIARPTTAHIDFLLPISGRYTVHARVRLPGHRFTLGGTVLTADGGNQFTTVTVGEVDLIAGPNTIEINLPANGAVDYIELQAPSYPAIEPAGGWQLDQPLTRADLAATVIRALQLQRVLPPTGKTTELEAENISAEAKATEVTKTRLLGVPSGGRWLRALGRPTEVTLAFTPPHDGIYRLFLRATGSMDLNLDGEDLSRLSFAPYLEQRLLGTFALSKLSHKLTCRLDPRAGVDNLKLQELATDPDTFDSLAGLDVSDPPTPADLDRTLKLLSRFLPPR